SGKRRAECSAFSSISIFTSSRITHFTKRTTRLSFKLPSCRRPIHAPEASRYPAIDPGLRYPIPGNQSADPGFDPYRSRHSTDLRRQQRRDQFQRYRRYSILYVYVPRQQHHGANRLHRTMDGSITVATTSGLAPFQYSIVGVNWQSSPTFTNLPASSGPDIITVGDANGCTGGAFTPLVAPCPMRIWSYAYNELIYSCGGKTSYIHIIGVTGGSGSFTYSLDGGPYTSNPDFNNLGAGWYTVYVNDGAGNIISQSFNISDECAVKATYAATVADCGTNDAAVTVTTTGGNTPYSYSLDGTNY